MLPPGYKNTKGMISVSRMTINCPLVRDVMNILLDGLRSLKLKMLLLAETSALKVSLLTPPGRIVCERVVRLPCVLVTVIV